jgi:hypothetical protein
MSKNLVTLSLQFFTDWIGLFKKRQTRVTVFTFFLETSDFKIKLTYLMWQKQKPRRLRAAHVNKNLLI